MSKRSKLRPSKPDGCSIKKRLPKLIPKQNRSLRYENLREVRKTLTMESYRGAHPLSHTQRRLKNLQYRPKRFYLGNEHSKFFE